MKKVYFKVALCIFICLFQNVPSSSSQDLIFSQLHSDPLLLNPSFAGTTGSARVALVYRDQWPGLAGRYQSFGAGYDQYVHALRGGVGFNLSSDNEGNGTIISNRVDLAYAPNIQLFDHGLAVVPSLDCALFQSELSTQTLTFGNSISTGSGFATLASSERKTVTVRDISTGLLVYTKYLSVGFSAFHLNRPDIGFYGSSRIPVRYTAFISYNLKMTRPEGLTFTPSVLYARQGDFDQLLPACAIGFKAFSLGAGYRRRDAWIAMAGFRNERFSISYSYDYTVSTLSNSGTGGAHELSMQVYLFTKHKPDTFLSCPSRLF